MQHKDSRAERCVLETPKLHTPCPSQLFTLPQWYVAETHPNTIPLGLVCSTLLKGHRSSVLYPEEATARFLWSFPSCRDLLSPCPPEQQLHAILPGKSRTRLPQNTCPNLTSPQQQLHQQPKQLSSALGLHPCQEGVTAWGGLLPHLNLPGGSSCPLAT